jgi:Cu-Zn family superoxide dismutase
VKRLALLLLAACNPAHGRPVDHPTLDEQDQVLASARSGTGTEEEPTRREEYEPKAERVTQAVAVISPTKGNHVSGTVTFLAHDDGVAVHAVLTGVPQGAHALHVHMVGDCSAADATSAGGPFALSADANANAIWGGLGEVTPMSADGTASIDVVVPDATLEGERSILGRSVVVHARGNDLSKPPDGNAGPRLGCGVIGVQKGSS